MEEIKDARFSHISTDPRFRSTPKSVRKVKIDKRFQPLFTDKRFQVKYSVDKRGKPVDQSSHENFRKYYDLSTDDDSSEEEDEVEEVTDKIQRDVSLKTQENVKNKLIQKNKHTPILKTQKWVVTPITESDQKKENKIEQTNSNLNQTTDNEYKNVKNSEISVHLDEDKIEKARMTDDIKVKLRDPNFDYARGVGVLMSDSSSEDESSEDLKSDGEEVEHGWGELDRDADTTDEPSERLAVLHMDWDRIRAVDLMVLLNSFLPPSGIIKSITIYPSQFGLDRMKEEEEKGPIELVSGKSDTEGKHNEESKDGKQYHMERLRQYQLNRLKYYYAIIEFDSAETANKVYTECDGLEYESSSTKLDLRFVPEGETFDQEPHEVCTSMPDPAKYEPRIFTNTALQQGKVELTWDETDPGRQELTKKIQKNPDNIDNTDLEAYMAYSSEEDIEDHEQGTQINEDDVESDLEDVKEEDKIVQYKSLLASLEEEEEKKKNRDIDLEITWGVGLKEKAAKSIKEKLNTPQTPFEEMLEKRKHKKKLKRETKEKLKEKQKVDSEGSLYSDDDIPSDIDLNSSYFKDELQGTKLKKKKKTLNDEPSEEEKQKKAELELLLLEENDVEKQKSHFNMKTIQGKENDGKKKKRRKHLKKKPQETVADDDFQVDVADDRFGALFTSHHFNIDPAEPQFRKTKAMEAIISEKLKRRKKEHNNELPSAKFVKTSSELPLLVKSIKTKTKHIQ